MGPFRPVLALLLAGCGGASVPATPSTPHVAGETSPPSYGAPPERAPERDVESAATTAPPTTAPPTIAPRAEPDRAVAVRADAVAALPPSQPHPAGPSPATAASARMQAAIVASDGRGPRQGTYIGFDGEREYEALGLPAISPEGRSLALIEGGGDGTSSRHALVTVSVATGALERRDELSEARASEEDTPQEAERWRAARVGIGRAQRYLARRRFVALEPLAGSGLAVEEPTPGVVELRDASGRTLHRAEVVPPAPEAPADLHGDALDAWEVEHLCDDRLEDVSAWRIDATRVLLVLRIGATPDECWVRDEHQVITLGP